MSLESLCAQESASLVIHMRDGSTTQFVLDDQPKVKFEKDSLVVTSFSLTMKFKAERVQRFTYSDVPNSVKNVAADTPFTQNGESLLFHGQPEGTTINIYTESGSLIKSVVCSDSGDASVSLQGLVVGIYLVQIKDTTYKLIKR